jgi:hypothetical protein
MLICEVVILLKITHLKIDPGLNLDRDAGFSAREFLIESDAPRHEICLKQTH